MKNHNSDSGIALILVMLAILVLTVLAAAMVFTGRSESMAAFSFKVDTEADYVAKAAIQNAINWLRSSHYVPAQMQTTLYYNVTAEPKYGLYSSNNSPIQCVAASPACPSTNSNVQLIGYGSLSSNFPNITNTLGTSVTTQFAQDLNGNGSGVRITGDSNHAGLFWVNMYLLNYQTVNCSSCGSAAALETWLITAKGQWTGGSNQSTGIATAEEQAIAQPVYYPTFGDAMYGFCSVSMSGSAGTCTDAFNSALGPYGGGNTSVAAGACDQNVTNVIASDSNVGANGYVSIGNNPSVAGNVIIGNANPSLIPSSCCSGSSCGGPSSGHVAGSIITGAPFVPAPAVPTFPSGFPGTAPSYSSAVILPVSCSGTTPPPNRTPGGGSKASPYLINSISSNSDTFTFNGGANIASPIYYDIASIGLGGNNSAIAVNGYVVFNVSTSIDIKGQGVANSLTTAPEAVQINYAGTGAVSLHGNAAMTAILNAPLATVDLGGGGSSGYFVGAIRALNVSDQGGYPMHYDVQLSRLDGVMGQDIVSSYARIKQ
jgi:hypothetical protein